MRIGHGILPFVLAGSIPYPHIARLSSVKDEHCMVGGGGRIVCRSESHHSSKILNTFNIGLENGFGAVTCHTLTSCQFDHCNLEFAQS